VQLTEVYRSSKLAACQQRAFVLHAVGIPSEITEVDHLFALFVSDDAAVAARDHVERYEIESAIVAPQPVHIPLRGHAWIVPLLFTATMFGAGLSADTLSFGVDWYDIGALRSAVPRTGEWWRLVTALTLHVDVAHLLGNVGFGVFFGFVAAQLLGAGVAWFSIIISSVLGNLLDSVLMPGTQTSIGASTAVFATLGIISAYTWRTRHDARLRWAQRSAPLVAGIVLLALIGTGGERTDVLAHLAGFFCGAVFGAVFAKRWTTILDKAVVQWSAGVIAIAAIIGAWAWAIVNA
jgi:membrane associated rhomboid family serine protease